MCLDKGLDRQKKRRDRQSRQTKGVRRTRQIVRNFCVSPRSITIFISLNFILVTVIKFLHNWGLVRDRECIQETTVDKKKPLSCINNRVTCRARSDETSIDISSRYCKLFKLSSCSVAELFKSCKLFSCARGRKCANRVSRSRCSCREIASATWPRGRSKVKNKTLEGWEASRKNGKLHGH